MILLIQWPKKIIILLFKPKNCEVQISKRTGKEYIIEYTYSVHSNFCLYCFVYPLATIFTYCQHKSVSIFADLWYTDITIIPPIFALITHCIKTKDVPVLNKIPWHTDKWGTSGVAPHFLKLDTRRRWAITHTFWMFYIWGKGHLVLSG